ncbi:MAG: glycosyltransferase family 1 protein [Bryobacteraceae bacterium]|nr:glycosyltransferase family 1 protein [Bryobacteraceae bacterium]
MRISIDCTPLLVRSAGVKNYLYHWLRAIRAALPAGDVLSLYPLVDEPRSLNHQASQNSLPKTVRSLATLHLVNKLGWVPAWAEPASDVFHVTPHMRADVGKRALTTTLYDLTTLVHPEMHLAANVAVEKRFHTQVLRRAARVLAISEHTRRDALEHLGLPPERVQVVYPGVAEPYFHAQPAAPAWLAARGLQKPFALCVGTIEPRKNVERLLAAWLALPAGVRTGFDLVIAGPAGWKSEAVLARLNAGVEGVRYLGYVPEDDLPALTASAILLAYPSLYEGFGFPAAQAMACGVPVLTSTSSCLPEIVGDAGLCVDPVSEAEIRAGLERLLTSPALREQLGRAGRDRAQLYTWERCGKASVEFFRAAMG